MERTSEDGRTPAGELSKELDTVCRVLDFTPKSTEEIRGELPRSYQDKPLAAWLMQLTVEGIALQVSPGHFCLKG